MLKFFTLKPETFGLDISNLSLKIIKLKKRKNLYTLASFGEEKISPGIIKEGEIKDEESLSKIIKESLSRVKGEKLKTKYVIASLPEEKAFLQVIQFPKIPFEDLKSAIIYEAENHIPLSIEEVYLDFQIISPPHNHQEYFDILIGAMPKKTVNAYASSIKKAGLIPKVLEVESVATARALIKKEIISPPTLLIDFGLTRTVFIIFSGNSLRFTCSVPISSQKFTEEISKSLRTDLKEAEELKLKYGIKKNEEFKNERKRIFEALKPSLDNLVEQIKTYLNYYQTHASHEHFLSNGKRIEKILISGGGANLKGLTEFLSSELKIPVEIGNPWINILPGFLKEVPRLSFEESLKYTTVLGLALRGTEE